MHPVINFRCGRTRENAEKTRDFRSKCLRTLPTCNEIRFDSWNRTLDVSGKCRLGHVHHTYTFSNQHRFQKSPFSPVHTTTQRFRKSPFSKVSTFKPVFESLHFQTRFRKSPLSNPFSKVSVSGENGDFRKR